MERRDDYRHRPSTSRGGRSTPLSRSGNYDANRKACNPHFIFRIKREAKESDSITKKKGLRPGFTHLQKKCIENNKIQSGGLAQWLMATIEQSPFKSITLFTYRSVHLKIIITIKKIRSFFCFFFIFSKAPKRRRLISHCWRLFVESGIFFFTTFRISSFSLSAHPPC